MKFFHLITKTPKGALVIAGFLVIAFIGIIDRAAGPDSPLALLYLVPVAFAVWFIGNRTASAFVAVSLVLTFTKESSVLLAATHGFYLAVVAFVLSILRDTFAIRDKLSGTDPVTGVTSRGAFYDLATTEISRTRRYKRPFTAAYLDIDNLKMINYRRGYAAGDQLLHLVGETIRQNLRDVDIVSRVGGDEFAILLPETGPEGGQVVLSRLKSRLIDSVNKREFPVTFSFGATTFLEAPETVEDMVKKVGVQMYSAKNAGVNTIDQDVVGSADADRD